MGTIRLKRGTNVIEVPEDITIGELKRRLGIPPHYMIVSSKNPEKIANDNDRVVDHFRNGDIVTVEPPRIIYFD
ncbi:hypothetical protein [Thermofilum sp.]|uniref:hypothetical protein n=1 Tax=Thermofilum sp. TaxID=1961369 RepID=UPI0031694C6D